MKGTARLGIHSPSCRSVATDKGDVLRPLLIRRSGKGLQILYLLSPHNSSGLEATNTHTHTLDTHTAGCIHTSKQNKHKQHGTLTGPHKFIHMPSLLSQTHTHTQGCADTLYELKQMKELVNEVWLDSLKCSTAALRASVEQNDDTSQSCRGNNRQEHRKKGICFKIMASISAPEKY